MALAVLATGNHHLFDIAAGLLVTVAGFGATRLSTRMSRARASGSVARRSFALDAAGGGEAVAIS